MELSQDRLVSSRTARSSVLVMEKSFGRISHCMYQQDLHHLSCSVHKEIGNPTTPILSSQYHQLHRRIWDYQLEKFATNWLLWASSKKTQPLPKYPHLGLNCKSCELGKYMHLKYQDTWSFHLHHSNKLGRKNDYTTKKCKGIKIM